VLPANPDTAWLGVAQQPRTQDASGSVLEFGSIGDALQAAEDGDSIHLLPGTHVTSQVRASGAGVWCSGLTLAAGSKQRQAQQQPRQQANWQQLQHTDKAAGAPAAAARPHTALC
jgi:hypothetical protein